MGEANINVFGLKLQNGIPMFMEGIVEIVYI